MKTVAGYVDDDDDDAELVAEYEGQSVSALAGAQAVSTVAAVGS